MYKSILKYYVLWLEKLLKANAALVLEAEN